MAIDGPGSPRPPSDPDRLLLVLERGRDRELLSEWLDSFPEYEVLVVGPEEDYPEYDLCLVHERAMDVARSRLTQRKAAADPVHLPHVLLRPTDTTSGGGHDEPDVDWTVVDDVVALPADQSALRRRLENMLEARRSSLRLVERENQYEQLVELTPEGIFLVDDAEIVYANTAAVRLLRAGGMADLRGRSVTEFVAPEDESALAEVTASVSGGDTPASYVEMEFETVAGTAVPVSVAGVVVTYNGRPVTQLVVRDLTERKARERQLDLFGRAVESASQGITIADAGQDDEPLVYVNDAFERITGYHKDECLGRNCRFLQGRNTSAETVQQLREAVANRRPVSVEILNYRSDGTPFWNALDIVPVENEDGDVTHFLGLQRDVTERKEREQRVAVLDRVLRHNLRNRTNVIRGYADLIGDIGPDQARTQIREAAEELLEISEQVRAFRSVVTEGSRHLTSVDLEEIVTETVDAIRLESPEATIGLSGRVSTPIRADATLPAALRSLLEMAADGTNPDVSVHLQETPDGVTLELTDRGDGLDDDDLRVVARGLETPLEHIRGIDLWLVRWSVEQSSGEFTVDLDGEYPTVILRFLHS